MERQPPRLSGLLNSSNLFFANQPKVKVKPRPGCARRTAEGGCPHINLYIGVAVFLGGLKNGRVVTLTFVLRRIASIVISICNEVPGLAYSVSTLANAINFFRIGDQLVVVALPTCLSPE